MAICATRRKLFGHGDSVAIFSFDAKRLKEPETSAFAAAFYTLTSTAMLTGGRSILRGQFQTITFPGSISCRSGDIFA